MSDDSLIYWWLSISFQGEERKIVLPLSLWLIKPSVYKDSVLVHFWQR